MRKWVVLTMVLVMVAGSAGVAVAHGSGPAGPAPNSGDGVPDGSGMDAPNGINGSESSNTDNRSPGPAPNSGDGVPDGSGMDAPNGPNDR